MVRLDKMETDLVVRFRVAKVYKNCYVSVYYDKERVFRRKHKIMTPGEMEQVVLKKEDILKHPQMQRIQIRIEEG